jgi:hypothetical protein
LLQKQPFDVVLNDAKADGAAFNTTAYTALLNAQGDDTGTQGNFFTVLDNAKTAGEGFDGTVWTAGINLAGYAGKAQGGGDAGVVGNFFTQLDAAKTAGDEFNGSTFTASLNLDAGAFSSGVDSAIKTKQQDAKATPVVGKMLVQTQDFAMGVQNAMRLAQADADATPIIGKVMAQTQGFRGDVTTALEGAKTDVADKPVVASMSLGRAEFDTELANVKASLEELAGTTTATKVLVKPDSLELNNYFNSINGKTMATVKVKIVGVPDTSAAAAGFALGGVVGHRPIPAAALGRVVQVGEFGPELALLPYGSQVMPHGAAQARMREEAKAAPAGGPVFNAPVTFVMQSADVQREVARQLRQRGIG